MASAALPPADVHHGVPRPRQRRLRQTGFSGRHQHQRRRVRVWRRGVLCRLRAAGSAEQSDHAQDRRQAVDVPDHGDLGPGVGRDGLRPQRNHVLRAAFSVGRRRSGLLPRRHPLPHLLVPERGAGQGHGLLLFRRAAGIHLWQPVIRSVAGARWRAGQSRLAMAVRGRGPDGYRSGGVGVLLSR